MSQERLQAELLEAKKEIERLKERASKGSTQAVNKDLSLISVIPKWLGSDDTVTIEEFLESIEAAAKIGRWNDNHLREVAVLRLTVSAKLFYKFCDELHEKKRLGKPLRKPSGKGTERLTQTNITSPNCRRLGRCVTKARNSLQTNAKFGSESNVEIR